jgi:hypothetical protein
VAATPWPLVAIASLIAAPAAVRANPAHDPGAIRIAALVPADDARQAIAIGVTGEVYEPDGQGGWVHRLPCSTAQPVATAGRAGNAIVALGGGAVYRLAANGWSAIRLVRRGKAILGAGAPSMAAVGRQLFALEPLHNGEPTRLAVAPATIVAIAAGARAIVVATDAGVYQLAGARLVALRAPRGVRLVSDRWGIVERGALELTTARIVAWPRDLAIGVAAGAPGDALVAIGASAGGLELVTVRRGKLARDPLGVSGTAVGVVVDRAGRAAVALSDGRIAVRDAAGWTITQIRAEPLPEHPGAAPATSR